MTLLQKLRTINVPRIAPLHDGNASTIEEFWDSFIVHNLPEKEVVLKWHKVLMEYVNQPDAMFAIRGYNTASKDNYDSLRRGFLTRTDAGYSFFYTDNFHAAYFLKMALDRYVPTAQELLMAYNSRKFPARFGRDTSNERDMMAIPKGVDPGIQTAGYKIAHILNVGKNYYSHGQNLSFSQIIQEYFDGGQRCDWNWYTDTTGSYFLRDFHVEQNARRFLVAEFLRFVHPFNYFLTPKKTYATSSVSKDIAEYQPLVNFVQAMYADMYGDDYNEFLSFAMVENTASSSSDPNTIINLKYGPDCIGTPLCQPAPQKMTHEPEASQKNHTIAPDPIQFTDNLEFRVVVEYLTNPKTSFRKLEREFMGIDSPARGGGFVAKSIVNSYGITAKMKGILSSNSIEHLIQTCSGKCKQTLVMIKELSLQNETSPKT